MLLGIWSLVSVDLDEGLKTGYDGCTWLPKRSQIAIQCSSRMKRLSMPRFMVSIASRCSQATPPADRKGTAPSCMKTLIPSCLLAHLQDVLAYVRLAYCTLPKMLCLTISLARHAVEIPFLLGQHPISYPRRCPQQKQSRLTHTKRLSSAPGAWHYESFPGVLVAVHVQARRVQFHALGFAKSAVISTRSSSALFSVSSTAGEPQVICRSAPVVYMSSHIHIIKKIIIAANRNLYTRTARLG